MRKRLFLSDTDKKIAGVCGGLAEYLNIDPTIIRTIWAVAAFCYGTGFIAYLIFWIVVPRENKL